MTNSSNLLNLDPQSVIISRLRFPLIVLVVYLHSYGLPAGDAQLPLMQFGFYEIVRTSISLLISHSAVPAFFFISGFLMFYHLKEFSFDIYITKMNKRFYTLFVPYVLWNLIALFVWGFRLFRMGVSIDDILLQYYNKGLLSCFWIFGVVGDENIDIFGRISNLTVPADLPLWYLRDLIVVSFFSPIIYMCIKRFKLWFISILGVFYLLGLFQNLPGLSSVALFFYCFGAYFSITKIDFSVFFHKSFFKILVLYIFLFIYLLVYHNPYSSELLFPLYRFLGVFVFFGLADRFINYSSYTLPQIFSEATFFVFVIHYILFMSSVDNLVSYVFPETYDVTHAIHYLICPLIKVGIYVAIYAILKQLTPKMLSIFVGNR